MVIPVPARHRSETTKKNAFQSPGKLKDAWQETKIKKVPYRFDEPARDFY
jgi:hypothetical protein